MSNLQVIIAAIISVLIYLLGNFIFRHRHKWEEVRRCKVVEFDNSFGSDLGYTSYTQVELRCTECGKIKIKKLK